MKKLFSDLKNDEEKSAFFLSGRGYETGVIAQAIQNDVAMAYHRCSEYKKELEALQSQDVLQQQKDREDAERYRYIKGQMETGAVSTQLPLERSVYWIGSHADCGDVRFIDEAIDNARRIEGDQK